MKAWTTLLIVILGLAAAAPAHAATCAQLTQQITALQTSVAANAAKYWSHRANFLELQNGRSRSTSSAATRAQQEQSAAAPLKAGMPGAWQSLRSLVQAAKSQGCLTHTQLQAIHKSVFKLAKSVNFDPFTTTNFEGEESTNLPTWMPR